jgi:tetratricopeptide (TPR) repeat protein
MDDQMEVSMEKRNEKQSLLSRLPERRKVFAVAIVSVFLLGFLLVNQNGLGFGTDADSRGNLEQLDGFDTEIDTAVGLITDGKNSDAEVILRKVLDEAPNHVLANFNMGVMAQFDNQLDDAINYYSTALVGAPMFKSALYNRGLANRDVGNIEQAIADLNTVIANYPDSASAAFNLGNILIEKGDQETGNAYIARALKLDPSLGG